MKQETRPWLSCARLLVVVIIISLLVCGYATNTFHRVFYQIWEDSGDKADVPNLHEFPFVGFCSPEKQACNITLPLVPNIVHFIWFHEKPAVFRFHHYMSGLSVIRIQSPREIVFWYNLTLPYGPNWEMFLTNASSAGIPVRLKIRERPTVIFGKEVSVVEHAADITRLEVLLTFGGIYIDLDVLILRPLTPLMCYPVSLGQETHDKLNNGIILSMPNAEFIRTWYSSYQTYDPQSWDSHNVRMPYKLFLMYPSLVHVERNCLNRPNWKDEERTLMFTKGLSIDWSKNYALHLWYRWYGREMNTDAIKIYDNLVARIFHYVYFNKTRT